jgi:GlcNAc-PI de-N-acetylase
MRNFFLLCLVFIVPSAAYAENTVVTARNTNRVASYFGAHPDDWQLFMNPNAYYDVQESSNKVVFVYVTAGDAGVGLGNGGRSQPYYLARENGAKLSVKFMADAAKAPEIPRDSVVSVAGHPIKRWLYRNTISYFMRLPDGNPQGTGYVATAQQSLKRLHEGAISKITSIDNSTIYNGWSDLRATLRKLIEQEIGTATNAWVNIPDTNIVENVGDHADHQHMAQGVLEAIADIHWIDKALYLDYVSADMQENMSSADREIEAGTFAALSMGLTALDHPSPWDRLHRSWLRRHYFRIELGVRRP